MDKEKSGRGFLGSYNGVGDGPFVGIHLAEKMLDKNSFASFYSFMCLNISGC
jgi:hypothetical protein